jgi:D-alanyl-D-alanine carboxypeptidase/D-alanyl-D-alanine-endopeptidase (penicillin-binding protein 4)
MPLFSIKLLLKLYPCFLGAVFLFTSFPNTVQVCLANEIPAANQYIQNGGYALSRNGKITHSTNSNTLFIPASTIKLVTSLASLEILGPDFRFHTRIYLDAKQNLIVQGFGDPLLVSEKVNTITKLVAEQGIIQIQDIILDDYAFSLDSPVDGSQNSKRPYDVNCSALAVNFNSLPLQIIHEAKVKSPESQTPYLPIMGQIGKNLSSGIQRVNIDAFPEQTKLSNSLLYCGQLFQVFLEKHGIQVNGSIKHGHIPAKTEPLLDFIASETVSALIESCLLSSNNFMANQLYLALGVKKYGFPATWEKSQRAMKTFIEEELQLSKQQLTMVEGSGLSSKNRITPEAMLLVLERFRSHAALIPIKYGTRMKSGTLTESGVFCYAGYIPKGKENEPFVIFLNQRQNRRDKILKLLYRQ